MDPENPVSDCLLVRNDRILRVCNNKTTTTSTTSSFLKSLYPHAKLSNGNATRIIIPGVIDAHAHMMHLGKKLSQADLVGAGGVEECRQILLKFIDKKLVDSSSSSSSDHDDDDDPEWIYGHGWDQTEWNPPVFPRANDLDSDPILQQYPIALSRIDYHAVWLNKRALSLVQPYFPVNMSVIGGEIVLDVSTGNPTGVLIDAAMEFLEKVKPVETQDQQIAFLERANDEMIKYGITTIHDAGVSPKILNLMKRLMFNHNTYEFR